ncbi:MAG: carboxylating nicotinate-nucleotide diphosphorylase [Acidimicrobiaceae bacterium]|nr:carboxylating nicotinate-nucleotide diphosphorylase [Acidimicrobiaceae bacterium]MBT6371964.1 carboxylating nicotinate-nucleotide diphosphorylase [Acidimicrobiaceae bacterium]
MDAVADAVVLALHEDLTPDGDLSAALVPADAVADGVLASRADGVLAGSACATEAFAQLSDAIEVVWLHSDGDRIAPGDVVATVRGPLAPILTAERTALNFLCRLSGVATTTARWVEAAGAARIWDTRKTTPGLRALERAAVRAGGGWNHRTNLSHWVMLKDNHLTGTDIVSAVASSRSLWPARTVHVECETLNQVRESLEAGADALLLDNMTPTSIITCVAEVHAHGERHGTRPLVEASGGITLDRVADYAATGVDCISTSALTNGAPSLDLGLDLDPDPQRGAQA